MILRNADRIICVLVVALLLASAITVTGFGTARVGTDHDNSTISKIEQIDDNKRFQQFSVSLTKNENTSICSQTSELPLPDLRVVKVVLVWVDEKQPGDWVGLAFEIMNSGSTAVTQPFYYGVYLDSRMIGEEMVTYVMNRGDILTVLAAVRWPNDLTSHVVTVKADSRNQIAESNEDNNEKSVTDSAGDPPNTPRKPSGTTKGKPGISYSYSTRTTDPNGDQVRYYFDWGDGTGEWTNLVDSGETVSLSHSWNNERTYIVKVKAEDQHGTESDWSSYLSVSIASNFAPEKPARPVGQVEGKIRREYTFSTHTTDFEEDQIYYLWDWGDGSSSEWLGPHNSGDTCQTVHKWKKQGEYNVKVKAKDEHGKESSWSDSLIVTMPKNKIGNINPLIIQFLENHPHLFPILRQIVLLLG